MYEVSDFKRGLCFVFRDQPVMLIDFTTSTPTARGGATIAKSKLRNLVTGQLLTESIRSGEKFARVDMERSSVSFLYTDGSAFHFMDAETFEQFELTGEALGDQTRWLTEAIEGLTSLRIDGNIVSVDLPQTVVLEVVEADPVIKGATAKAQYKRSVVSTGAEVQVPGYVVVGQRIKIDTRDGHFVERVRD
jgi:elongation factor P